MLENWAFVDQTKTNLQKLSNCRTGLQDPMTAEELAMPNDVCHITFATSDLATPACNIYQH